LVNNKLYKGHYFICFYDADDEFLVAIFDNTYEILAYRNLEVTPKNIALIRVEVCNALKRDPPTTKMLDGTPMHVHLIDLLDKSDDEFIYGV